MTTQRLDDFGDNSNFHASTTRLEDVPLEVLLAIETFDRAVDQTTDIEALRAIAKRDHSFQEIRFYLLKRSHHDLWEAQMGMNEARADKRQNPLRQWVAGLLGGLAVMVAGVTR